MANPQQAYVHFCAPSSFIPSSTKLQICRKRHRQIIYNPSANLSSIHAQGETPDAQTDSNEEAFQKLREDIQTYLASTPDPGASPLAYVSLGKNGRTDLISRVMDFGGYIQVSARLGLPVDKNEFIPPPPTITPLSKAEFQQYEDGASIALGRDLEARLASADQVSQESSNTSADIKNVPSSFGNQDDVPSAQQLAIDNENIIPPVVDEAIPDGERFTLTVGMRIGILLLASSFALGFGRASAGVVDPQIINAARSTAQALSIAHIFVAAYVGIILAPQLKRNAPLWALKTLLGGPASIRHLRSLGSL